MLIVGHERAEELKTIAFDCPSVALQTRQLNDLELLLNGGFAPLDGFMAQAAYRSVLDAGRLPGGQLWPIPITLGVNPAQAESLTTGAAVALRDSEGFMLAMLTVEEVWQPDLQAEAQSVYGTTDPSHLGVRRLMGSAGSLYVGGRVEGLQMPGHFDYETLRHSPDELRHQFAKLGWRRVVAFHTSQPMHRKQREITLCAAKAANAHILLHPSVGETKPGDLSYHARVKCYQAIQRYYPHGMAALSLLPLAMRMAGPKEALWHAIVRRNFGLTHFIVGEAHASPPASGGAGAFYPADAAMSYVDEFRDELGIEIVSVPGVGYSPRLGRYVQGMAPSVERDAVAGDELSPGEFARRLSERLEVPSWYSYPEVLRELAKVYRPKNRIGITLFFTGLSGSGKSTLAQIIYGKFIEEGHRSVTLLDGDVVRRNLSSELGFSRPHRDLNVRRIGFVASEISKNGGVAICAPIAPYADTRRAVRELIEQSGAFIEIHVSTPLEICEQRDRKGLYAKARKGIIPEFTGISDPYEEPETPEIRIDTSYVTPVEAAQEVFLYLLREGYLEMEDPVPLFAG